MWKFVPLLLIISLFEAPNILKALAGTKLSLLDAHAPVYLFTHAFILSSVLIVLFSLLYVAFFPLLVLLQ